MNRRRLLVVGLATLCIAVAAAAAGIAIYRFYIPQKVKIVEEKHPQVEVWVGTQLWTNGTLLDWGTLTPGSSVQKFLDVYNIGDCDVVVTLIVNLPSGWSLTWPGNGTTIPVGGSIIATYMTLTVPVDATPGDYAWDSWVIATPA